jgi:hypothetical protein
MVAPPSVPASGARAVISAAAVVGLGRLVRDASRAAASGERATVTDGSGIEPARRRCPPGR